MLKPFIAWNIKWSRRLTPSGILQSHAVNIFDWVGRALLAGPGVRTVLDVGAGRTWHFGPDLKRAHGFRLIGLDDSAAELALNPDLDERIVGDACRSLGVTDGSVDLVLSRMTVEHLADTAGFIAACHRALRPDGRLALVFTNRWAPSALLNRLLPQGAKRRLLDTLTPQDAGLTGFPAHYDRCLHSELRDTLRAAGFEIEHEYNSYFTSSYFAFFLPLYLVSIALDHLRMLTGIRNLSSQCLFVARRP
jgi:SAM-dependent methyltransferase